MTAQLLRATTVAPCPCMFLVSGILNSMRSRSTRVWRRMRAETQLWWRQAEADLETARILLPAGRFYAVSWFSQQAVEKGLKALFSERRVGAVPPRTHDLEFLGDELSVPSHVRTDLAILN